LVSKILNGLILNAYNSGQNLDSYFKIKLRLFNATAEFIKQYKLNINIFLETLLTCFTDILTEIQTKISFLTTDLIQMLLAFFRIFLTWKSVDKNKEAVDKILKEINVYGILEKEIIPHEAVNEVLRNLI
jgi:hypothetical protein